MRVLFIARYLQMVNHRKVIALAAQPGIDLWHLAPRIWTDEFRSYTQILQEGQGYRLLTARIFTSGDIHRFVYWPPTLHLREIQPDIIHIEEEPDSLAALEAICARRLWAPSARLALFTWQNIRRNRAIIVDRIARYVLHRVNHAIAGNREAANLLRQQDFANSITILPQLGVDVEVFKRHDVESLRSELGIEGFVAGYIGRFAAEKGIDDLLRAAARVPDVHLLLVGRGSMQSQLEALAETLGLTDRFTIVNAVPHDEVPQYLNLMNVLVLPSRTTPTWKEQFGHVLIEAMACGVPVIGSDSGAIPEVIAGAGLIFPEGDMRQLADHIRQLLHDPDRAKQSEQQGLARVMSTYTHEQIAKSTAQIYHSMVGGKVTT